MTITDLHERCLEYQKNTGAMLTPSTIETITKQLGGKFAIERYSWSGMTLNIYDDGGLLIGYTYFDHYFSNAVTFYDENWEIIAEHKPMTVVYN